MLKALNWNRQMKNAEVCNITEYNLQNIIIMFDSLIKLFNRAGF